jgi:hypothetical protein
VIRFEAKVFSPLPPANSRGQFLAWLQAIGYRLTSPPFLTSVILTRGSIIGNVTSFNNARLWLCMVTAVWKPAEGGSEATLEWRITTIGQVCNRGDMDLWRYEIQASVDVAAGHTGDVAAYRKAAGKAQNAATWRTLILTVAGIGPVVAGLIFTGSAAVSLLGGLVVGAAAFFGLRAPRDLGAIRPRPLPQPHPNTMPPVL